MSAVCFSSGPFKRQFLPSANLQRGNTPKERRTQSDIRSLIESLEIDFARVNEVLRLFAPEVHAHMQQVREKVLLYPRSAQVLEFATSLFTSIAILVNRTTGSHYDRNCHPDMWDAILTGGSFSGGQFSLPEVGVTITYEPGTLLLFHGNLYKHEVGQWTGKTRRCIALFQFRSVLAQLGMDDVPITGPIKCTCT